MYVCIYIYIYIYTGAEASKACGCSGSIRSAQDSCSCASLGVSCR